MRAGPRRTLVTIERPVEEPNGSGGFDRGWIEIGKVMAHVVPVGGTERLIAGTLHSGNSWRVTMLRRDVTDNDRLKFNDIEANVVSVADPDGRRRDIVLLCEFQAS